MLKIFNTVDFNLDIHNSNHIFIMFLRIFCTFSICTFSICMYYVSCPINFKICICIWYVSYLYII